jgi:hypothetical protein
VTKEGGGRKGEKKAARKYIKTLMGWRGGIREGERMRKRHGKGVISLLCHPHTHTALQHHLISLHFNRPHRSSKLHWTKDWMEETGPRT